MTRTDEPLPHHEYTDEEMHNETVAHETSDANIRSVLAFAGAIAAVLLVSAGLMRGLFYVFEKQAERRDPPISPVAAPQGQPPQGPRLLTNEPENLRRFRAEESGKLERYGWMNQSQGVANIPIESAKKLVVQHGLPVRAEGTADPTLGTHAPAFGESSGGRTIPVPHASPAAAGTTPGGAAQEPPAQTPPSAGQEIKK